MDVHEMPQEFIEPSSVSLSYDLFSLKGYGGSRILTYLQSFYNCDIELVFRLCQYKYKLELQQMERKQNETNNAEVINNVTAQGTETETEFNERLEQARVARDEKKLRLVNV